MKITIDGPAGSGKSTAARKLAAQLDIAYLDTGAMYRALAYAALQRDANFSHEASLIAVARSVVMEVDCGPTHTRVRIDGHDVTEAIRTMEVSAVTSSIAKCAPIRAILVDHQRRIGQELVSFVTEGRDQGSVVFPDADVKFVLDASLPTRAERRYHELLADGQDVTLEAVAENLHLRDRVDSKQWEPLLMVGRAFIIDTTDMSLSQVVEQMAHLLERKGLPVTTHG